MEELTAEVKAQALGGGFDLVGVARAGPAATADALHRWLDAGMHGEMAWMADSAADRTDPRRLLSDCRSLVMVARSYRTSWPDSCTAGAAGTVWISRYAWGRDYHRLLKRRLIRVGRWLADRVPGCAWRAAVDTLPLLEREWAARAGLGWIGKNTSLLNRSLGSELFLGALLTDLPLIPDGPAADHCGRCTACLDACPTGALVAPRLLDARRCIAYLTVEHRGSIPAALSQKCGDMVAGCDICQEVCPFTRRAPADLEPAFQPMATRHRPPLDALDALDETGYRAWREGSALGRIPFASFRRNLTIARANLSTTPTAGR